MENNGFYIPTYAKGDSITENTLKSVEEEGRAFFKKAFNKIYLKPELYDGSTWQVSKLEIDMEFFVAKSLDKIYPSGAFPEIVEKPYSVDATLNITAEPFLRDVCLSAVDVAFERKLKTATKSNVAGTIVAYDLCREMTTYACNNVFELTQNSFSRAHQKEFQSKQAQNNADALSR